MSASLPIAIRPVTHEDFEAIAAMMQDFAGLHHGWQPDLFRPEVFGKTPALFQTRLDEPDALHLAAEYEGKVAGYISAYRWMIESGPFTWTHRAVYIGTVMVAPHARRKGIGQTLFKAVEDWAEAFGAQSIGLHVVAQNAGAQAFYASLGYHPEGQSRAKQLRRNRRVTEASSW